MVVVTDPTLPRIEIDGRAADIDRMRAVLLAGYGHFTAMQVRAGRVRGLHLHLDRLAEGNRELFGADLDRDRIRDQIRHALDGGPVDASVRVLIQCPDSADAPSVTVIVRPPATMPGTAKRLQSVPYQRCVAHIKHINDFGQAYYGRVAERNGFDEALLTGPDGIISEGSITNIGFFDGSTVVWPAGAVLQGITMQLLQRHGPAGRLRPVRLADVPEFAGAFVTNSQGIAAVRQIDSHPVAVNAALMADIVEAYESVAWDLI
jgi:branched-subunit amino acid aminotransferase/4-amino-4-deoxychorismate lyase